MASGSSRCSIVWKHVTRLKLSGPKSSGRNNPCRISGRTAGAAARIGAADGSTPTTRSNPFASSSARNAPSPVPMSIAAARSGSRRQIDGRNRPYVRLAYPASVELSNAASAYAPARSAGEASALHHR